MRSQPPIAITCECGEERSVPYGETWTCESCSRRWNTAQIPAEAYESRNRRMRRFQLEILGFAVVILAVFAPLVLFVESRYLFLGILVGLVWLFFYMPFWRRRVRRAIADAPRWELTPD